MDLWGHCVVDVLIQLVNFLENTSTQFCARACAIRQFVITLVVFAPVSSAFGFVLLNDLDLLFDDGLQVLDFGSVEALFEGLAALVLLFESLEVDFFGDNEILIGEDIGLELLNLLFVLPIEVLLDQGAFSFEDGGFGGVTGLNKVSVQCDYSFSNFNLKLLNRKLAFNVDGLRVSYLINYSRVSFDNLLELDLFDFEFLNFLSNFPVKLNLLQLQFFNRLLILFLVLSASYYTLKLFWQVVILFALNILQSIVLDDSSKLFDLKFPLNLQVILVTDAFNLNL